MNKAFVVVVVLLCLSCMAQADVFNLGSGLTNLETVTVGDPGNSGELSSGSLASYGLSRVCGAVSYTYRIGKYEVTAGQYCDFLNHKAQSDPYELYNSSMWTDSYGCKIQRNGTSGNYSYSVASDWANRPVNFVSFWDGLRFANWLNNGQGNGSTETGAYTLTSAGIGGNSVTRNSDWKWAVTSEDEWYKAAYYKGGGTSAGYWDYPTRTDSLPSNLIANPDPGNNANFQYNNIYSLNGPYWRTNVGEFENSRSAYGTFDQAGNVREWTESIVQPSSGGTFRNSRGGSFLYYDLIFADGRDYANPAMESRMFGFRVAQAVPEPSSLLALAAGLASLLGLRRRRACIDRR